MIIYLMRHAQTQENLDGVVQGWLNSVLTERGKKQAKEAANSFNQNIDAIFCSDLRRCTQTAKPFLEKFPGTLYAEDSRLRERDLGDFQGKKWSLSQWRMYWEKGEIDRPLTNSEAKEHVTDRLEKFLSSLHQKSDQISSCLIITHGGVINRLLEITNTKNMKSSFVNSAITRIKLD